MAVRIRLARHGRKKHAIYYVVVADAKSPRDGRFIEKLGTYNPNTDPATIEIDADRALHWYLEGAQPSDTVRAILKYRGVLKRAHLYRGISKGVHTKKEADTKFEKWLKEKKAKQQERVRKLKEKLEAAKIEKLKREKEKSDKRAEKIAKKNKPPEPPKDDDTADDASQQEDT